MKRGVVYGENTLAFEYGRSKLVDNLANVSKEQTLWEEHFDSPYSPTTDKETVF